MIKNVLVGCEESQAVANAFRELGHNAYSCDIQPCSGGHPEYHMMCDVREVFYTLSWDLVITFPPCTDLAVSGAAWFARKRADGSQQRSIDFFMLFVKYAQDSGVPLVIENPIGIMSNIYRKPDQIVQPWQFGHPESKATCFWLHNGLKPLKETNNVKNIFDTLPKNKQQRMHYLPPSSERAKLRSKTFPGIARAMAEQWGGKA